MAASTKDLSTIVGVLALGLFCITGSIGWCGISAMLCVAFSLVISR